MLQTLVALLLASVVMVPISRRLGFGAVLGNLIGGAVIGPVGLGLIRSPGQIESVSELGVVMLLFLIGLELRPQPGSVDDATRGVRPRHRPRWSPPPSCWQC